MNNQLKRATALIALLIGAGTTHAEVVVIVNAKNPVATMTEDQVAGIYLGKDTSFAPMDLPGSAAQRTEFYSKVAKKDAAQVKAIWARLVFTGKTQPPKEVSTSADAVKQVASNEKGIAYVDRSVVDSSVKAVLTIQ